LVKILDGAPDILIVVFHVFPQSLQTNAGIVHDRGEETESLGILASSGPIVPDRDDGSVR
jgi:hypothetical protein